MKLAQICQKLLVAMPMATCARERHPSLSADLALQCQWQAADQFCWSGIDAVDNPCIWRFQKRSRNYHNPSWWWWAKCQQ